VPFVPFSPNKNKEHQKALKKIGAPEKSEDFLGRGGTVARVTDFFA